MTAGQTAYEADRKLRPNYHDGKPRPPWEQLSDIAQWSWNRPSGFVDVSTITEYGLTQKLSNAVRVF